MRCVFIMFFIMFFKMLYAQLDSFTVQKDYLNMSLTELLNVKVNTKEEKKSNLFSSKNYYELTENEIQKFFIKSIPEALRLIPGVLVVETTASNYYVGINTMENSSLFSNDIESSNVILIIDGFIQNESLDGNIAWEKLNISINDVYKIEVFYGAGGLVFDETAISGVINITTKSAINTAESFSFNSSYSSNNDGRVGGYFKGKSDILNYNISYDVEQRNRYNDDYYYNRKGQDGYVNDLDVLSPNNYIADYNAVFPQKNISKQKQSLKIDLTYKIANRFKLKYSFSYANSLAVKNRILIGISDLVLSTWASEYFTNTITFSDKKLKIQILNKSGTTDMFVGLHGLSNKYDENTTIIKGEYIIHIIPRMYLRPNFSFKEIILGDNKYTNSSIGLFNRQTETGVFYGGLDFKWTLSNKLTTLSSIKWSKITLPNQRYYPSYSMEVDYSFNKKHGIQFSYNNIFKRNSIINNQILFPMGKYFTYNYNRSLDSYKTQAYKLSYKGVLNKNIRYGLGIFTSKSKNYNMPVMSYLNKKVYKDNQDMKSYQYGITSNFSCNLLNDKLIFQAYITITYAYWKNFCSDYLLEAKESELNRILVPNITPTHYGGLSVFFQPFKRIQLNSKAYFFDNYNYYSALERSYYNEQSMGENGLICSTPSAIPSTFILDAGIKFQLNNEISTSFSASNFLANSRQVYAGDKVKTVYSLSINLNY